MVLFDWDSRGKRSNGKMWTLKYSKKNKGNKYKHCKARQLRNVAMTGWHRQLCPRKHSSKANKTMALYLSDAPHPSLPLWLESIPPNWLQGPFHTLKYKAQLFALPLATSTHLALSCAHAGDMDLSYSQNMAYCTCLSRSQTSYALLDWLVNTELFSFIYLWSKSMEMVKLWLRWESVKRSCFSLIKSPYSLLKNWWGHFGFHGSL